MNIIELAQAAGMDAGYKVDGARPFFDRGVRTGLLDPIFVPEVRCCSFINLEMFYALIRAEYEAPLRLAAEALVYHTQQTRPIHKTNEALTAIHEALSDAFAASGKPIDHIADAGKMMAEPVKQEPPLDAWADEQQDWAKLDGTTAFHLIERHAEDWAETGAMMEAWLRARSQPMKQEPLAHIHTSNCPKCKHKVSSATGKGIVWWCPNCKTEWPFDAQITMPDVCGEVCERAKLCYGCGKNLDEANQVHEARLAKPVAYELGEVRRIAAEYKEPNSQIDSGNLYWALCEALQCIDLTNRVKQEPPCWCRTCRPITLADSRMILCPDCGNKRCPKATDHRLACTNSNDPGQPGSAY